VREAVSAASAYIGVIGGSEAEEAELRLAREVGARVARAGAALVCGGRGGVMEAACGGAREYGGLTIGVLPGLERAEANAYVEVALPTGLGELRNGLIVRFCDAMIAIGGGWGTLSEIAFAMRTARPIVAFEPWVGSLDDVASRAAARESGDEAGESGRGRAVLRLARDAGEAVELALSLARDASSAPS